MSFYDDVLYLTLLVGSIVVGRFLRPPFVTSASLRVWLSSAIGVAIVVAVSGAHALHCVAAIAIQVAANLLLPARSLHAASFALQFSYLLFFRLCSYAGLPSPPPHTNAVMMIMTLKLIGVALEVREDETRRLRPSALDLFHYMFSHAGVLTGPYYKYRTYADFASGIYANAAPCDSAVLARIGRTPLYLVLFLASGYLFPLDAAESEDFYATTSTLYRMFYMFPVFFNFRMRMYTGFVLAECSCIAVGLGAYPVKSEPKPGQGPKNLAALEEIGRGEAALSEESYDFETVHNIDEWRVEAVPTFREALKTWNMTVQYWLAVNVYKALPGSRAVRTLAVMVTSSVWHGVYSGYYLSLGSVPFVLMVEDLYDRIMRRRLPQKYHPAYDWLSWFMRVTWFSYLGMAFRLLRIDTTLQYWSSVYYIGHLVMPLFYVAGLVIVKPLVAALSASTKNE